MPTNPSLPAGDTRLPVGAQNVHCVECSASLCEHIANRLLEGAEREAQLRQELELSETKVRIAERELKARSARVRELEAALAEAERMLRFYGNENNWRNRDEYIAEGDCGDLGPTICGWLDAQESLRKIERLKHDQ